MPSARSVLKAWLAANGLQRGDCVSTSTYQWTNLLTNSNLMALLGWKMVDIRK